MNDEHLIIKQKMPQPRREDYRDPVFSRWFAGVSGAFALVIGGAVVVAGSQSQAWLVLAIGAAVGAAGLLIVVDAIQGD